MSYLSLKYSVVQFLKQEHENSEKCDICFEPLQSTKTSISINEDVLREVLRYLFTTDEDIESNIKRLNSCEDCRRQFINLTQLSYQLEKLRKQFNHLRKKVGKLVILGCLSNSKQDWKEWIFETKYFEDFYPLRVPEKATTDVGVETDTKYTDIKLTQVSLLVNLLSITTSFCPLILITIYHFFQMTPVVVLQRVISSPETSEGNEDLWIEKEVKFEEDFTLEAAESPVSIEDLTSEDVAEVNKPIKKYKMYRDTFEIVYNYVFFNEPERKT